MRKCEAVMGGFVVERALRKEIGPFGRESKLRASVCQNKKKTQGERSQEYADYGGFLITPRKAENNQG